MEALREGSFLKGSLPGPERAASYTRVRPRPVPDPERGASRAKGRQDGGRPGVPPAPEGLRHAPASPVREATDSKALERGRRQAPPPPALPGGPALPRPKPRRRGRPLSRLAPNTAASGRKGPFRGAHPPCTLGTPRGSGPEGGGRGRASEPRKAPGRPPSSPHGFPNASGVPRVASPAPSEERGRGGASCPTPPVRGGRHEDISKVLGTTDGDAPAPARPPKAPPGTDASLARAPPNAPRGVPRGPRRVPKDPSRSLKDATEGVGVHRPPPGRPRESHGGSAVGRTGVTHGSARRASALRPVPRGDGGGPTPSLAPGTGRGRPSGAFAGPESSGTGGPGSPPPAPHPVASRGGDGRPAGGGTGGCTHRPRPPAPDAPAGVGDGGSRAAGATAGRFVGPNAPRTGLDGTGCQADSPGPCAFGTAKGPASMGGRVKEGGVRRRPGRGPRPPGEGAAGGGRLHLPASPPPRAPALRRRGLRGRSPSRGSEPWGVSGASKEAGLGALPHAVRPYINAVNRSTAMPRDGRGGVRLSLRPALESNPRTPPAARQRAEGDGGGRCPPSAREGDPSCFPCSPPHGTVRTAPPP